MQPGPALRHRVVQAIGPAVALAGAVHLLGEDEQPGAERGGRRRELERAPEPRAERRSRLLAREQELVDEEQRSEEHRRHLRQGAGGRRDEMELQAPQERSLPEQERAHDTERREQLAAAVQQIHHLGVERVHREQRRRAQGQVEALFARHDAREDRAIEGDQRRPESDQPEQLIGMEHDRLEPAGERVVDRQAERRQRPVGRVRGQAAEGGCVGEEARRIGEAANVDVGLEDVAVVEVEGVAKEVRIGGEDQTEAAEDGESPQCGRRGGCHALIRVDRERRTRRPAVPGRDAAKLS